MSRFTNKKRALLTAAITSLVLVAVAIAFYSTAGDGSGTGSTADGYADNLEITGDLNDATLVPGSSVEIDGNVHNPNPGSAHVTTVVGGVDASGDCDDTYFTIDDVVIDDVIAAGGDEPFDAEIEMEDDPAENQDDCKDAVLTITWSSAAADATP